MARISLLLFIAVVLTISSVSAHPPKKTKTNLCPPTLSELQTFPSLEISKLIQKKLKTAPNTPQFNTFFAICKAYSDYLAVFKVTSIKSVFHAVRAKHAMMNKAMLAAQAAVGVEGDELGKSYAAMASGFVELEEMIAEISASYKFDGNAEISKGDRVKTDKCLVKLKGSINVFVKVISKCSERFSAGKEMGKGDGFLGGFFKKGVQFGGNLVGAGFGGHAKGKVGGRVGGKVGAQGEVKVGGHAGAKVGGHAGAKVGAETKVNVGGQAGGFLGGSVGFGGEVQYDVAGKAHVSGGGKFRPLSYPHNKHLE